MRFLPIIFAILFGVIGMAVATEYITIYLQTLGFIDDKYSMMWDLDRHKISDIRSLYCEKRPNYCKHESKLRVENNKGRILAPHMTLREAGVRDGDLFFVKS